MLIDIPLTGDRTYIHGADIFDALTAATGAEQGIRLSLRSAGACAMELCDEASVSASIEPCGRFRYVRAGGVSRHVLLRLPDRPISVRVPMCDDTLVAGATFFADRAVVAAGAQGGTYMRRISALAVALLERGFPQDHWSIAEISCLQLPRRDARVEAMICNAVGNRFWKIAASSDGVAVGHVVMARGLPRR
jgi:hypothetical protein